MSEIDENEFEEVDNLPDNDQVLGIVENMKGASRLDVRCMDGEERICRIPGSMKDKVWIEEDDIVIVEPWDFQDEKGDVEYKYTPKEVQELEENDVIGSNSDESANLL